MIPAILAAPLVQNVVGGVVGGVASLFSPPTPMQTGAAGNSFHPYLDQASSATSVATPSISSPSGTLFADDLGQMSPTDAQSWAKSLAGKHVDATDNSGRTITGQVAGMQMLGSTLALNIGGHLVSISQLKQISWSPSAV